MALCPPLKPHPGIAARKVVFAGASLLMLACILTGATTTAAAPGAISADAPTLSAAIFEQPGPQSPQVRDVIDWGTFTGSYSDSNPIIIPNVQIDPTAAEMWYLYD